MMVKRGAGLAGVACLLLMICGCTGGQETEAQTLEEQPAAPGAAHAPVEPAKRLLEISPAIPLYTGATFRPDLTRRDSVMVRQQFGDGSEVLTLGTDDSFPQVWHYYVTYLAQYRAYNPPNPYPPENQHWRTLEVHLNSAMQDPFIPGDTLRSSNRQVVLQISETEAEPETIIRYIVTPQAPAESVALQ